MEDFLRMPLYFILFALLAMTVTDCGGMRGSGNVTTKISGAGSIEYIGNPQVTKQINGIGRVRQRTQ
jgi:hypothetical protein